MLGPNSSKQGKESSSPRPRKFYTDTAGFHRSRTCNYSGRMATAPSGAALAIASGILGLVAGYFLGQGSSIGLFDSSGNPDEAKKSWPNSYDVKVHADSSDEEADDEGEVDDEDEEDEGDRKELKSFEGSEEVKLVLAVRTDLGMGKGITKDTLQKPQTNIVQAKLLHSVHTLPLPATSTSSTTLLPCHC